MNRRQLTLALAALPPALGLAACSVSSRTPNVPGRAGWAWTVHDGGSLIYAQSAGLAAGLAGEADPRPFTIDTPLRVASVTKLAVSLMAHDLAGRGVFDLDASVADILPVPDGVTLRRLLEHRSGLSDPDVYWAAAGENIRTLFSSDDFRGGGFKYSNLNYGLAATVIEARTGRRFDRAMGDWLRDNDIPGGLNWSGVPDRADAATLYRRVAGDWIVQNDGPGILGDTRPDYLGKADDDLSTYVPGTNGTLFSPQGGLRTSVAGLIALGRALAARPDMQVARWQAGVDPKESGGDDEDAHFTAFGRGAYVYVADRSPIGLPLVGHHGEAYGALTGVWIVPGTERALAYATNATPDGPVAMTGGDPNISTFSRDVFRIAGPLLTAAT